MSWVKKTVIFLMVLIFCTGCSRYSFFNEFTSTLHNWFGKDYVEEEAQVQLERYDQYGRPPAFTEKALTNIAKLTPVKKTLSSTPEDNYESIDINTLEMPENPYVVPCSDPDRYYDTAEDLLNSYFNYFVDAAGGYKNAPENVKIDYLKVRHNVLISGDIEEFALEVLVDIHVPDVQHTDYAQYGIAGSDGAIHCAFTIHARRITDYTFEFVGIVQSQEARKVILTDIGLVLADPKEYTENRYQIKEGQLHVSYDGGKTWVDVPITMEKLFNRGDGNGVKESETLESGSYFISLEQTIFIYGGSSQYPVTLLLSEDQGQNWREIIVNHRSHIRRNFINYVGETLYVLSCGDRTMGQEWSQLYISGNGGTSWSEGINPFPETSSLVTGCTFITRDIGFITVTSSQWPDLCRTEDGGKTWRRQDISPPEKYYTMAYTPEKDEAGLNLYIGQAEYGEMQGIMWKMVSTDQGKTWKKESCVMR
ncbi:MAG: hypothetical protein ACOWWR_09215 [Eubacteriales bacterium]